MLRLLIYITFVLTMLSGLLYAEKDSCDSAPIPAGSVKIENCRYKSPRNYTETIKFYKKLIGTNKNYEFKKIIIRSDLRAIHIKNNNPSSKWEGINIYEHKRETRIFIIPHKNDGRSSNGRTTDSGSVYLGSNPSLPARYGPIV